jgi:hypothetical protein
MNEIKVSINRNGLLSKKITLKILNNGYDRFQSPYVAARVFSPLVIYKNVDIVHVFIEIYRIRY